LSDSTFDGRDREPRNNRCAIPYSFDADHAAFLPRDITARAVVLPESQSVNPNSRDLTGHQLQNMRRCE
jgi:hypothetical protein